MKLISGPASPFGRKVRVTVIEAGLAARVEVELFPPDQIAARTAPHNPLAKVPVLFRDDGSALYDSSVICEYLDSLSGGPKLFPPAGEARWTALRLQALGNGIGEAVGVRGAEKASPAQVQFAARLESVVDAQTARILRSLDHLEANLDSLSGPLTIGQVAVACGLGYVDFREPDFGWRASRPKLAGWFEAFSGRESMQRTFYRRPAVTP